MILTRNVTLSTALGSAKTPRDYALVAQRACSAPPMIGLKTSAARAIAEGAAVAFPRTNNAACVIADANVATMRVEGLGLVHAGFWQALCLIVGPLLALPTQAVTVGHSQGALVILFAALLCEVGRPPVEVYAFEPPRVSIDASIGGLLNAHGAQVRLYRKRNDVVPPLPPALIHPLQLPASLKDIGGALLPVPNTDDRAIDGVIASLTRRRCISMQVRA